MYKKIRQAADYIRQADALLITAGSGMNTDSGLPDFRGKDSFGRTFPSLKKLGKNIQNILTPDLFHHNPQLAWGFYGLQLNSYRNHTPHTGYYLLKQWAEQTSIGAYVFTSNIDDYFQAAGFAEQCVINCHGVIHLLQCLNICHDDTWTADHFHPQIDEASCLLTCALPVCPKCGGLARPNTLMFHDNGWLDHHHARKQMIFKEIWLPQSQNLVIIELGAGKAIPTVRHFSNAIATQKSAPLIRINPTEPQVTQQHHIGLNMNILAALTAINKMLME